MGKLIDLTGKQFGKLTVIERAEDHIFPNGKRGVTWKCLCSCKADLPENEKKYTYVLGENLKKGYTSSCGCYQKEKTFLAKKKYNSYDLSGEYGIGYTTDGDAFWFDKEDYEKIKNYYWFKRYDGYFIAYKNKSIIRLNRLVMGVLDNQNVVVDHLQQKLWDNRKSHLRVGNKVKNARNHKLFKNNTSGCTGVSWLKCCNKWYARITVNYKEISLGLFEKYEDAVEARKKAEEKYFGSWSFDNSQKYGGNEDAE